MKGQRDGEDLYNNNDNDNDNDDDNNDSDDDDNSDDIFVGYNNQIRCRIIPASQCCIHLKLYPDLRIFYPFIY